VLKTFEIFLH
jgi:hypothetical protein